jgi:hypothetical protein
MANLDKVLQQMTSTMRTHGRRLRRLELMERGGGIDQIIEGAGFDWNKIYTLQSDGTPKEENEPYYDGLKRALENATEGDIVLLPPMTIVVETSEAMGDYYYVLDIPVGVTLMGMDKERSIIQGSLTAGNVNGDTSLWFMGTSGSSSYRGGIKNLTIDCTVTTDATFDNFTAIITNNNAYVYDVDVVISVEGTAGDDITGINCIAGNPDDGMVLLDGCNVKITGTTTANDVIAFLINNLNATSLDKIFIRDCNAEIAIDGDNSYSDFVGFSVQTYYGEPIYYLDDCHVLIEQTASVLNECTGFYLGASRLSSCSANIVSSGTDQTCGVFSNENTQLNGCRFDISGAAASAGINDDVIGILLYSSRDDSIVSGCEVDATNTGSGDAIGVHLEAATYPIYLHNSAFRADDYGIRIDGTFAVYIYSCQYMNIFHEDSDYTDIVIEHGDRQGQHITTITGDTTLDENHHTVIVDASGGDVDVTLPPAATYYWKIYEIKRIDSSANTVTVDGDGAETIDDSATQTLNQYDCMRLQSDGSEWWIL